ncbi:uncharacterized protein DNG_08839 [Cephalotrichum gorgonifer]|uniref:Myb-like domain-containing protein n=1 Tax=Cephalotrichum gorgonifer TaxID=2041049 RepID=A0AAE8SYQ4_9PEZI|nr:uncharacterized protein DNG_08839 [Cephalotrichum gorgonifer]
MPKHSRVSSSSHHRYNAIPVPVSLNASSTQSDMYNTRMSMSAYYPDAQAASLQLQADQQYTYMAAAPTQPSGHESVPVPQPMSQPRAASAAWSKDDDESLMNARASGLNWSQIQQRYFPSKTPNACRKRHERLIERKTADNWNKSDFERLSMEYMRMRKEIWSPLAERVGEKWNVVEQKCMSNGLKNLQSAARAGTRRERLESGHQMQQGYDDDSGISGIGLTPVDGLDTSYSSPETTSSAGHSASGVSNGSGYQMSAHPQLQALNHSGNPYGYGPPHGSHHGYTSSVASAHSHSSGDGSYMGHDQQMRNQRLPSADMGIGAIIHRTPNNHNRRI